MTTKRTITLITAIVVLLIFCLVAPVKAFAENGKEKEQGAYQKESKQETILLEDVSHSMTETFSYEVSQMQINREQFTLYRPFAESKQTNLYGELNEAFKQSNSVSIITDLWDTMNIPLETVNGKDLRIYVPYTLDNVEAVQHVENVVFNNLMPYLQDSFIKIVYLDNDPEKNEGVIMVQSETALKRDLEPEESQEPEKEIIEETKTKDVVVKEFTVEEESSEIVNISKYEIPTFWDILFDMFKVIGTIISAIIFSIFAVVAICYVAVVVAAIVMFLVTALEKICRFIYEFIEYVIESFIEFLDKHPIIRKMLMFFIILGIVYLAYKYPIIVAVTLLVILLIKLLLIILDKMEKNSEKIEEAIVKAIEKVKELFDALMSIIGWLFEPIILIFGFLAFLVNWIVKKIRIKRVTKLISKSDCIYLDNMGTNTEFFEIIADILKNNVVETKALVSYNGRSFSTLYIFDKEIINPDELKRHMTKKFLYEDEIVKLMNNKGNVVVLTENCGFKSSTNVKAILPAYLKPYCKHKNLYL